MQQGRDDTLQSVLIHGAILHILLRYIMPGESCAVHAASARMQAPLNEDMQQRQGCCIQLYFGGLVVWLVCILRLLLSTLCRHAWLASIASRCTSMIMQCRPCVVRSFDNCTTESLFLLYSIYILQAAVQYRFLSTGIGIGNALDRLISEYPSLVIITAVCFTVNQDQILWCST